MSSPRISALTTGMSRTAAMHARAKNDMKPSPMPCCFWKRSLCSARSAITSLMSISLKVVRIAAVRCAWTRRSAIRRRMGLIGTRSSPSARGADGVGAAGTSIRTGRALRSRYASTSSLVSRPPLPDAGTRVGSRSCSARRRRTAGLSGPTARAATGAASASAGARRAAGAAGAGFGAGSGAAGGGFTAGSGGARAAVLLDARHQLADHDLLACGLHDAQHAGPLGGELHARLVGLELEQDVVRLDRLAVLLRPAHDDPLGHRLAERRDAHLERHAALRLRARLSGPARSSPGR